MVESRAAPVWKRSLDLILAAAGLVLLSPLFLAVALAIKLDSKGPVIFSQERIGRGFRPFFIYKFRTMVPDAPARGGMITAGGDSRITRIGRILRRSKVDELPQLFNVLRGDMSIVGPRPEVAPFVALFRSDYEEILSVRPGITDLASLKYRDEEATLRRAADPGRTYVDEVLPDKIRLAKEYVRNTSVLLDISLILKTVAKVRRSSASES